MGSDRRYIILCIMASDSQKQILKLVYRRQQIISMGGKQSAEKGPVQLNIDHPQFNNTKHIVIENKEFMQTLIGEQQKEYKKWKQELGLAKLSDEYLLLPHKDVFSSKGLCGSTGTLTLDFDNYPHLLSEEIYDRRGNKRIFQQCELCCAKKDMKPAYSKIGDVRPRNVFINSKGQIKISNQYSWPRESTNCNKVLDGEVTYLAPEELKQLEIGRIENDDNDQSEMFTIGLTLLSASLLEDFSGLYNIKNYTLDAGKLRAKVQEFNTTRAYSDIYKGFVNNLVELDKSKRLTPQEVWEWISPYQQPILNRQNFVIANAPTKLHQKVAEVRQSYRTPEHTTLPSSSFSGGKMNFPPPVFRETTTSPQDTVDSQKMNPQYRAESTYNNFGYARQGLGESKDSAPTGASKQDDQKQEPIKKTTDP